MKRIAVPMDWLAAHSDSAGVLLPDATGRYIARVLRLRHGDSILLTDGAGKQARATIEHADGGDVTVQVDTVAASQERESPVAITLMVGLP